MSKEISNYYRYLPNFLNASHVSLTQSQDSQFSKPTSNSECSRSIFKT